jgi:hypothetical protein
VLLGCSGFAPARTFFCDFRFRFHKFESFSKLVLINVDIRRRAATRADDIRAGLKGHDLLLGFMSAIGAWYRDKSIAKQIGQIYSPFEHAV